MEASDRVQAAHENACEGERWRMVAKGEKGKGSFDRPPLFLGTGRQASCSELCLMMLCDCALARILSSPAAHHMAWGTWVGWLPGPAAALITSSASVHVAAESRDECHQFL